MQIEAHGRETYDRFYDDIRAAVPPEQLLEFQMKDGWAPLCEFLGKEVPDIAFPFANDRETHAKWIEGRKQTRPPAVLVKNIIMATLNTFILAGLTAAGAVLAQNSTIRCAPGLKMFVSRGTSEPMGFGETGKLVEPIKRAIEGSISEYIAYPASNGNATNGLPNYYQSVGNGTILLRRRITEYAEACPDSKIAVFGYSQGAQIASNNFCGAPPFWGIEAGVTDIAELLEVSSPLPTHVTKNVLAVVLLGDPTHSYNAPYNYGNSTGNGIFWRSDFSACEALGNRIRAYCDQGDPFCDVGAIPSVTPHLVYILVHGEEIVQYVIQQYREGGGSPQPTPSGQLPPSAASRLSLSVWAALAPIVIFGLVY
ncbi:Acetylxylan esterase [Paramyrothecium foliicola]|nr:Acetylxylan esterase [Paramyrothecium foliicola]